MTIIVSVLSITQTNSMIAYENHQPKSGDSGIIKTEKIMDETEIRVAR